ncbi:hypothetical protein DASC09_052410 [Saccharomycopsis crataegensis]|uniref:ATPase domain-containing protein n=1 Tax=Saccharomycopsis crataegensis TaxID=43959 RepID=A0AAV5QT88_9ASCO|nr:hypothetical protein DASC09_052410 [Saccharomycopsis crataegensis]
MRCYLRAPSVIGCSAGNVIRRNTLPRFGANIQRFHTSPITRINPLLPIDPLETLEEEEVKQEKQRLNREKRKLSKQSGETSKTTSSVNNNSQSPFSEEDEQEKQEKRKEKRERFYGFLFKCLETSGITFASVAVLAAAGLTYHEVYENHVLSKLEKAFGLGDTSFDLAIHETANSSGTDWVERPQQKLMDDIVSGKIKGRYFLLIGEKGTGKTSLVLESFSKVNGMNCTAMDAHADPEIFRIRLGKALNFDFFEDYIGSLFSIRGPRDTTAILDIERAFTKLEEVAIKRMKRTKKPLVLLINSAHLIRNDPEGVNLVELLQQKAEELCGAGLVTMVFNSDDYWLYERMKKLSTKLEVISITDLNREDAVKTLKSSRKRFFKEELDDKLANRVYDLVGGRPQHLSEVSKHSNMIVASHKIIDREKTWFLNQCGLIGEGMDDDVMESGKFSTSAMLLAKEFVDMDKARHKSNGNIENNKSPHELPLKLSESHKIPSMPLWRARQIMTRPDYIQKYDDLNIFTIDPDSNVRADSVPMMRAFHEIVCQPGFDELLESTCDRVAAIESLGRTRELVAKDLVLGGQYKLKTIKKYDKPRYRDETVTHISLQGSDEDDRDEENAIPLQDLHEGAHKNWWQKRMQSDYVTTYSSDDSIKQDVDIRNDITVKED